MTKLADRPIALICNVTCVDLSQTRIMVALACLTFISALFYINSATVLDINTEQINGIFIEALVNTYGTDNRLSKGQFATLVKSLSDRHVLSLANITEVVLIEDHKHHCNGTEIEDCTEYLTQHVSTDDNYGLHLK